MNIKDDLILVLVKVSTILSRCNVSFHITGGIASSFYGEPRFTQDIDLVVMLNSTDDQVDRVIEALSQDFLLDEDVVKSLPYL